MEFKEEHRQWASGALGSENSRKIFIDLINSKINEIKDISTFRTLQHEKDLDIQTVYTARMNAALAIRDFAQEVLGLAQARKEDNRKPKKADI